VGGVIVMMAGLSDGTGGQGFYHNLADAKSTKEFLDRVSRVDRNHTMPDQRESQVLARILDKHSVIMVSDMIRPGIVTGMHMQHARTVDESRARSSASGRAASRTTSTRRSGSSC
jgi:nickel-dependent lactate racemase